MELSKRAVSIIKATFGFVSNNESLISNPEFFTSTRHIQSLITDIHSVPEIPWSDELDAYLYFMDIKGAPPRIYTTADTIFAGGDWTALDAGMKDRRYSMFGNLGLFFKYSLATLERHYGIHSFHASSLYRPDRHELIIVAGTAGAGKTVYLLEGLRRDYQVFSTEMTHFSIGADGVTFYKGALIDNVRVGNFAYDFPGLAEEKLGITLPDVPDPWAHKFGIDLNPVAPKADELKNPTVSVLFPKIEAGRDPAIIDDIKSRQKLALLLFNNATEKIGGTTLLYEAVPVDTVDSPELMRKRFADVEALCNGAVEIRLAKTVLASAHNCMQGI